MTTETKRVPDVGQAAPSFQEAKDAFSLLGLSSSDGGNNYNYQVVDEFFRQAELSAIESANPMSLIRNWLDKIVEDNEENNYIRKLPFGNEPGYTFSDFIRDEYTRTVFQTRYHNRDYRSNVRDFLYRITLASDDEANVGASALLSELIAEIGAQRGQDTATSSSEKLARAGQIIQHIENAVSLIRNVQNLLLSHVVPDGITFQQFATGALELFDSPQYRATVNAITSHVPSGVEPKKYGDLFIRAVNPDGTPSTSCSMTSSDPARDAFLMESFLTLEQAVRLRKVSITHKLGEVWVTDRNIGSMQEQSAAWQAVFDVLSEVVPGWHWTNPTASIAAVETIRRLSRHRKGDTRYCPECGHMGAVSQSSRDCCPDGIRAFYVPQKFAEACHRDFTAANANQSLQSSAKYTLQCREMGEEDFRACSLDEYCDAVLSPLYDTRIEVKGGGTFVKDSAEAASK